VGFGTTRAQGGRVTQPLNQGFRYNSPQNGESLNRRATPQPAARKPDRFARKLGRQRRLRVCVVLFIDMCIFAKLEMVSEWTPEPKGE